MTISRNEDSVNTPNPGPRRYRMRHRAAARDETRERIVRATMALHDEQGVAATTFADVAARAGVGPATVTRHFADVDALVAACGAHVVEEMRPPRAEDAEALFAGLASTPARIARLVAELDAFYTRGALRLPKARNDRDRIAALDAFFRMVEAGLAATAAAALRHERPDPAILATVLALTDFEVWRRMQDAGSDAWTRTMPKVIATAIARRSDR